MECEGPQLLPHEPHAEQAACLPSHSLRGSWNTDHQPATHLTHITIHHHNQPRSRHCRVNPLHPFPNESGTRDPGKMAARRSHSQEDCSDSSSSDGERERLKEAAWVPPGVKKCVQHQQDPVVPITPSLRVRPDNHEHDGNELQTTPEFRAHVAKKLAAILDSCIKEIPGSSSLQEPEEKTEPEDEGFRLLSTSIPGEPRTVAPSTVPKRKAAYSSSEDSEEENERRCREAAVSGLDILKHSALHPVPGQSSDTLRNDQPTKKHKKKKKKDKGQNEGADTDHQGIRQEQESSIERDLNTESHSNLKDLRQEHETNGFKKKKKRKNKQISDETNSDH
ncbi:PREDICTED: uncharacterized protein C12orf43 homolog [Nanorana parkeri]|uniref:uncharacterized protein C12orf43 homolog n=1 Tax=Nanorana parkeri TaxID=125878 RepID=UPI000854736E|nr:PREDICTED: uncharacterized protein C12orf43 homolog [Nanorana parkeri]